MATPRTVERSQVQDTPNKRRRSRWVAETACTPARRAAGLLDFFVEKGLLVSRVYGDFPPNPRVGRLSHFDGDDSERRGARVPRIQG